MLTLHMFRKIMVSTLLLCSIQTFAEPLSQTQWQLLQQNLAPQLSKLDWQLGVDDIDRQINDLAPEHATALTYLAIKQLSHNTSLTQTQKQWLEGLIGREQSIYIQNAEHPRSPILVTDIARQAQATVETIEINGWTQTLAKKWQQGGIQWADFLTPNTPEYHGLVNWLSGLDFAQLSSVALVILRQIEQVDLADNRLLYLLLAKGPQLSVLDSLWQRPVDRYTHKVLQSMSQWQDPVLALEQLQIAFSKSPLQSQVLMILAKDFSDEANAQQILRKSLQKPKLQWMTVALLPQVKNVPFRNQLAQEFANPSTEIGRAVLQQLQVETEL